MKHAGKQSTRTNIMRMRHNGSTQHEKQRFYKIYFNMFQTKLTTQEVTSPNENINKA